MIPEKLIIEGLYSYKKKTEIDFSTLCKADLFGIFGNVGSGKSAILEAVTYVLYGRIERLPGKMMNYNLMNLSSDIMHIDFIFRNREKRYRFTFDAKRNKKDFNKIETPKRSGYADDNGKWVPLFDKDHVVSAEEIIGLNYDNFRRTIIVPQGRFQEFLHLEKAKRTEMLMELFNLGRFDLYAAASGLGTWNSELAAAAEGELRGLENATKEEMDSAEKEAATIEKRIAELRGSLDSGRLRLREFEELSALTAEKRSAEEELVSMTKEVPVFGERRRALVVFEDCRSRFKSLLEIHSMISTEQKQVAGQFETASLKVESGKLALREAESSFADIEGEYKNIDKTLKQIDWLSELAGLKHDRDRASGLVGLIADAESKSERLKLKDEQYAAELENVKSDIGKIESGGTDLEMMNMLSNLYTELDGYEKAIRGEAAFLEEIEAESAEIIKKLSEFEEPDSLEKRIEEKEQYCRAMRVDAEVLKGIGKLSAGLEKGKPCPVCGSTEHPAPAKTEIISDEELQNEEAFVETEKKRLKELKELSAQLQAECSSYEKRKTETGKKLAALQQEKEGIIEKFPEGRFGPGKADDFRNEYNVFISNRKNLEVLQGKADSCYTEMKQLAGEIKQSNDEISALKLELATVSARISGIENRVDKGFLDDNRERSSAELENESCRLKVRVDSVKSGYDAAVAASKKAAVQNEKNLAEYSLLEKRKDELGQKTESLSAELQQVLAASSFKNLEEVSAVLAQKIDPEKERAEIESFERKVSEVNNRLENIGKRLKGRTYDAEAHEIETGKTDEIKAEADYAVGRLGELKNRIEDLGKRLDRKTVLQKELDLLKLRGENISVLKNLFKGKKFIDYAATIYLKELCEAANSRFRRLTRESLRLELDETNNFIIRDYLNEGHTRSVKTLSGGQTFQAAFSLSLSLADSIGRERSGFFFLDEGFGSLDRESLELVFDSLKSLKKEERTVGIISHVEELKQEIDTFISVRRDNDEGSIITESWR